MYENHGMQLGKRPWSGRCAPNVIAALGECCLRWRFVGAGTSLGQETTPWHSCMMLAVTPPARHASHESGKPLLRPHGEPKVSCQFPWGAQRRRTSSVEQSRLTQIDSTPLRLCSSQLRSSRGMRGLLGLQILSGLGPVLLGRPQTTYTPLCANNGRADSVDTASQDVSRTTLHVGPAGSAATTRGLNPAASTKRVASPAPRSSSEVADDGSAALVSHDGRWCGDRGHSLPARPHSRPPIAPGPSLATLGRARGDGVAAIVADLGACASYAYGRWLFKGLGRCAHLY